MKTQVIEGSARQIAETVVQITGRVFQAILFVEEPSDHLSPPLDNDLTDEQFEQIMTEMEAHTVSVGGADYSREGLYTLREGE